MIDGEWRHVAKPSIVVSYLSNEDQNRLPSRWNVGSQQRGSLKVATNRFTAVLAARSGQVNEESRKQS